MLNNPKFLDALVGMARALGGGGSVLSAPSAPSDGLGGLALDLGRANVSMLCFQRDLTLNIIGRADPELLGIDRGPLDSLLFEIGDPADADAAEINEIRHLLHIEMGQMIDGINQIRFGNMPHTRARAGAQFRALESNP